jgi:Tol biopolymer transport system component
MRLRLTTYDLRLSSSTPCPSSKAKASGLGSTGRSSSPWATRCGSPPRWPRRSTTLTATGWSTAGNDGQGNFSPDGSRITWITDRDGNFEIYSGNVDGSGATRLTNSPALELFPEWSPDGTRIAFTSQRDGNEEIYVMNADGTNPVRLTNDPGIDTRPSWAPDGRRLTFTSSREGNFKVFVMNDDGSGVMRVTDHPAGDGYSTWRP